MEIRFDKGWMGDLPDRAIFNNSGLKQAKNILAYQGSYYPVLSPVKYCPDSFSDLDILNYLVIEDSSLNKYNYIFCSDGKAYRFDKEGSSQIECFENITGSTFVSVETYGDWILAANGIDSVKVFKGNLDEGFEDLSGAPQGKFLLFCKAHLIVANLYEENENYPKKIRWSARENIEDWAPSLTTGADSQDFPESKGQITGLAKLGDDFVIFFEDSISLGAYSGGVYTFTFKHNAFRNLGCPYPKSIISVGDAVFFWGKDSIYRIGADGLKDIAYSRIKYSIFDNFNKDKAFKMSVVYDYIRKIIFWGFPTILSEEPDKILAYSIPEDSFTIIELPHKAIIMGETGTSEDLDKLTEELIEAKDELIDSQFNITSFTIPMVVNNYINSLSGKPLTATIEFPEIEGYPDILHCRGLKIRSEGDVIGYCQPRWRYSHNDNIYFGLGSYPIRNDQQIDFRISGRLLKFKLVLTDFQRLYGYMDADIISRGKR